MIPFKVADMRRKCVVIDLMQLTSIHHVAKCETDSGQKAGYYTVIWGGKKKKKKTTVYGSQVREAVCELLSHERKK